MHVKQDPVLNQLSESERVREKEREIQRESEREKENENIINNK